MAFWPYVMPASFVVRHRVRHVISGTIDLESPNFTRTSIADTTALALATSGWQLSKFKPVKNVTSDGFGGISRERFKRRSQNCMCQSRITCPINLMNMTSLAFPVG